MTTFSKAVLSIALCLLILAVPACNTTKGFGTDIEKAGAGMKNSADRNGAQ